MNTPLLFSLLLLLLSQLASTTVAITLKLIPPSNPKSPFYTGNHSLSDMIQAINSSISIASDTVGVRSPVFHQSPSELYAVVIGIRTFQGITPYEAYLLALDTGSSLIWLQCNECSSPGNSCFTQRQLPYKCKYPACNKYICNGLNHGCSLGYCEGTMCRYTIAYADKSNTSGYIAEGTFTTESTVENAFVSQNIHFGCGGNQQGFKFAGPDNNIAGILGMSWGQDSLVRQLEPTGRFSYCLQLGKTASFLTLGEDVPQQPYDGFDRATLHISENRAHPWTYWVNMIAIGVDNKWLPLKPPMRAMMDTGTSITRIHITIYKKLEPLLEDMFSRDPNLERFQTNTFRLCYKRKISTPTPFHKLPTISLKLEPQNSIFQIQPENAFWSHPDKEYIFCLFMIPHKKYTIIGARAQRNQRIIYDPMQSRLFFKPETCGTAYATVKPGTN